MRRVLEGALVGVSAIVLAGCSGTGVYPEKGVKPNYSFPVTNNDTPYTQCLKDLRKIDGNNLPIFAVGEVADKTGALDNSGDEAGYKLTQGVSEMMVSALAKTGKARLVERLDLRIPLAEVKLAEQGRLTRSPSAYGPMPASDFIVTGALTELNYNIVSDGAKLLVSGVGAGVRTVVMNVALDLRVVDSETFEVAYVSSLQKQILGFEVESNVFRFFGDTLIEFNAGQVKNEPLQLGVRSVVEMASYQIMTDFLGLPKQEKCKLVKTEAMKKQLKRLRPGEVSNGGGDDQADRRHDPSPDL
jgi:curli production assembly/transport component CsgG/holdfast attachment protein HfaB